MKQLKQHKPFIGRHGKSPIDTTITFIAVGENEYGRQEHNPVATLKVASYQLNCEPSGDEFAATIRQTAKVLREAMGDGIDLVEVKTTIYHTIPE